MVAWAFFRELNIIFSFLDMDFMNRAQSYFVIPYSQSGFPSTEYTYSNKTKARLGFLS